MRTASWHTSPLPYHKVRHLCESLGATEVMAAVLARRGYETPEAARQFLAAQGRLHDPFIFEDMQKICVRIKQAIDRGEQICVHGDYDVDGVTSTALLCGLLGQLGARVSSHLPNRFSEGYGIAPEAVERIAARGARLLLTVDCGIGAREQLDLARRLGLDVIVIDHHRPVEGSIPEALVIAPLLGDYPFKELAGVGLAFKFAQALLDHLGIAPVRPEGPADADDMPGLTPARLHPMLKSQLDLVALGTIADVVPLLDENRALVKQGLLQLARTGRPGMRALMRVGQVDESRLSAGLVAFRMAPRINAAGRLDDPAPALKLLLADSQQEADELARQLDRLNRERQKIENQMVAEAEEQISRLAEEQRQRRGYVLSAPGWHEGVIGIVASRMVELHHRPVIMIAENGAHGKGSGRSIPAFDLHGALFELGHLLDTYGGHRAACGLTVDLERLPQFIQAFGDHADMVLEEGDLRPSRRIDALVCGRDLTIELAEELAQLEPFGLGNPSVELLAPSAAILSARATRDGRHLQCQLESGGARATAIGFGQAFLLDKLQPRARWDVSFRLERNEFNGSVSPQLNLREVFACPEALPQPAGCAARCDLDCPARISGSAFWDLVRSGAPLPAAWQEGPAWQDGSQDSPAAVPGIPLREGAREGAHTGAALAAPGMSATDLRQESGERLAGRLIDRRGAGNIPGQVARLLTTGEDILLLVADVARRRRQLTAELPQAALARYSLALAGSRCTPVIRKERMEAAATRLVISDFATAAENAELVGGFDHLVFVDPPLNQAVFDSITAAAPAAFVHLFHCEDEVQFTGKVLAHEYDLREALARLYRRLETGRDYSLDDTTERLLLGGGKYLRHPALVARCLKILEELALIHFGDKDGQPVLTLPEAGRTKLERSPTYNRNQRFYRECLTYISKS